MPNREGATADGLKTRAIAGAGGALLTALMASTRSELIHGHDVERRFFHPVAPCVFVLWHGRLLSCAYRYRRFGLGTLISQNRDGDYVAGTIERWGYTVLRGSSSRGGSAALRSTVRLLRAGKPVALTPDGPRGPRQKMKIGPLLAAQMAGVPVVPITAGARGGWYVGSWDRFLIPRPFTWTPVALGEPVAIDPGADELGLLEIAGRIENTLNELTEMVDRAAGERRG